MCVAPVSMVDVPGLAGLVGDERWYSKVRSNSGRAGSARPARRSRMPAGSGAVHDQPHPQPVAPPRRGWSGPAVAEHDPVQPDDRGTGFEAGSGVQRCSGTTRIAARIRPSRRAPMEYPTPRRRHSRWRRWAACGPAVTCVSSRSGRPAAAPALAAAPAPPQRSATRRPRSPTTARVHAMPTPRGCPFNPDRLLV